MGYYKAVFIVRCGGCSAGYIFHTLEHLALKSYWECKKCRTRNGFGVPQPNVPKELWIGPEKHNQLKLYPVPPRMGEAEWALPFSIRSFVYQVSDELGGCAYRVTDRGRVMGMPTVFDSCIRWETSEDFDESACHMFSGWTKGQDSCPLWEKVALLCQTPAERRFLYQYLSLAKDRHFPMLIPQVRIGIAQRRRPDFVLFVPIQRWKYKWYAVQLDAAHTQENAENDELRDTEITMHGYEVIRLKGENQGYWEDVRRLVEIIERDMEKDESDSLDVAIDLRKENTS